MGENNLGKQIPVFNVLSSGSSLETSGNTLRTVGMDNLYSHTNGAHSSKKKAGSKQVTNGNERGSPTPDK